jgi:hypothetical protein
METLRAKLTELASHLNAAEILHQEIEEEYPGISLAIWPEQVQITRGIEQISKAMGVKTKKWYPHGSAADFHKSVFLGHVEFFEWFPSKAK